MAYVDQNGLIMIDEIEASEDVKKLMNAKDAMMEALDIINNMASINSAFRGETADAINVTTTELVKKVNAQKTAIEDEIRYINQVVEKYRTIDANMKNQINSAMM